MKKIKYFITILLLVGLLGQSVEARHIRTKDPNRWETVEEVGTAPRNAILTLMFEYQKQHGKFLRGHPTDENNYYGWQLPGALLSNAFYEGKQVSFHWYGYTMGQGEEYELIDIFVNESETEVIIFAIKDMQRYVFHSTEPSYPKDGGFNLELTKDPSLRQFMEEENPENKLSLDQSMEAQHIRTQDPNRWESIEEVGTAPRNSILALMFWYQKENEKFLRGTPTDENLYYYEWQVPSALLSNAAYEARQASFHWYGYTMGQGQGDGYELIEIFVNESGTEVIIFATKDMQRYVFHSKEPSYTGDGSFNLELTEDDILDDFMEEASPY